MSSSLTSCSLIFQINRVQILDQHIHLHARIKYASIASMHLCHLLNIFFNCKVSDSIERPWVRLILTLFLFCILHFVETF